MNNLPPQRLAIVERVEGDEARVRDEDGVERTVPNDREFEIGERVKLVLADDGSVAKVLNA